MLPFEDALLSIRHAEAQDPDSDAIYDLVRGLESLVDELREELDAVKKEVAALKGKVDPSAGS